VQERGVVLGEGEALNVGGHEANPPVQGYSTLVAGFRAYACRHRR
jgi:hypothetical protein